MTARAQEQRGGGAPLVLLTGGSRGLGFEAAARLAARGYRVVLTARTLPRAEQSAAAIRARHPGADVRGLALDLARPASVAALVDALTAREAALQVLVANATHWPEGRQPVFTEEGVEVTFATNHLGHFRLATALLPLLEEGARAHGDARLVVVSSRLHLPGTFGPDPRFDFDDPDLRCRYDPTVAYKNSKLAGIWFAYEWDRRYRVRGITGNAFCPGFVPETVAQRSRGVKRLLFRYVMPRLPFATRLAEAAGAYVHAATDPALQGVGGRFFGERREIASSPASYDPEKAARLWRLSEAMTGR